MKKRLFPPSYIQPHCLHIFFSRTRTSEPSIGPNKSGEGGPIKKSAVGTNWRAINIREKCNSSLGASRWVQKKRRLGRSRRSPRRSCCGSGRPAARARRLPLIPQRRLQFGCECCSERTHAPPAPHLSRSRRLHLDHVRRRLRVSAQR